MTEEEKLIDLVQQAYKKENEKLKFWFGNFILESIYKEIGMEDNWKHRSKVMSCNTCMWFVVKARILPDQKNPEEGIADVPERLGRCRKHAPTMNGFPAVYESDWCGDHKLDENKI